MSILDFVSPRDLANVNKLQVFARGIVEGYTSGRHRSPHQGFSVEFKEHRPYVRGDELRSIDWKIFGKSDRLFVRQYEEETNLRCHLMVDVSGSMSYGSGNPGGGERPSAARPSYGKARQDQPWSKRQYATRLAACLSYLMLGQQDAVGLVTFDRRPVQIIPAKSRPSHLKAILAALLAEGPNRETDLGQAFRLAASKLKRRGLVLVLSDAMGDIESLGRSFAQLRASHHDVVFFQILHPDELTFPFEGRVRFRNLENLAEENTVEAASLRSLYLQRLEAHQDALRTVCRRYQVDLVTMTTDQSFIDGLRHYAARRRRSR